MVSAVKVTIAKSSHNAAVNILNLAVEAQLFTSILSFHAAFAALFNMDITTTSGRCQRALAQ